ncbi:MAG: WecB/TagA/CpsF family glycosyltransferase [Parcubacteria group bacterium]|jgi:N-acetylglucosaminyldiphosphoundecaprenol N-acetyl-beta-D-mannosaminyltransferase
MRILGVRIDNYPKDQIVRLIDDAISGSSPGQKFIVTLNPEIILKARANAEYKRILNSSDLNVCDGFGVKLVSFLKRDKIRARIAGADLVDHTLKKAAGCGSEVLVIVRTDSLSRPEEIEKEVRDKYGMSIAAEYCGNGCEIKDSTAQRAEIVFVNFGAPEQESYIFNNKEKFPRAKILVGVGGTFDFITEKIRRAPKILRSIGLEWLWRLLQEPKRLRRIINAVVVFPIIALTSSKE